MHSYGHNAGTYAHLVGDVTVKGDIEVWMRVVFGRGGNNSKVYCGGNFSMVDESSFDNNNGSLYVKGDARINNSWVHCKAFISNTLSMWKTWYYKNMYCINLQDGGKNKSHDGARVLYTFNASLVDKNDNIALLEDLGTLIKNKIDYANKLEEEINKRLDIYNNTVNAIVKKWSSPKPVSEEAGGDYVTGGAYYPQVGGSVANSDTTFKSPDNPNEFIISCNVLDLQKIELLANQVLTIDTSKKNIHIVLRGDLIVGSGATIRVRGSNMAFIYLEGTNKQYVEFGNESKIGIVEAVNGASTKNAGLHIVSNKDDLDLKVGKKLDIRSFNYIPYGYLDIAGGKNTVYSGSFVIGYIDIGGWSSSVFESSYVKFNGEKSPLILDITNDMQYGDTIGEIQDYGQISWDIIDYV